MNIKAYIIGTVALLLSTQVYAVDEYGVAGLGYVRDWKLFKNNYGVCGISSLYKSGIGLVIGYI